MRTSSCHSMKPNNNNNNNNNKVFNAIAYQEVFCLGQGTLFILGGGNDSTYSTGGLLAYGEAIPPEDRRFIASYNTQTCRFVVDGICKFALKVKHWNATFQFLRHSGRYYICRESCIRLGHSQWHNKLRDALDGHFSNVSALASRADDLLGSLTLAEYWSEYYAVNNVEWFNCDNKIKPSEIVKATVVREAGPWELIHLGKNLRAIKTYQLTVDSNEFVVASGSIECMDCIWNLLIALSSLELSITVGEMRVRTRRNAQQPFNKKENT